jgi:hypothetical protein
MMNDLPEEVGAEIAISLWIYSGAFKVPLKIGDEMGI